MKFFRLSATHRLGGALARFSPYDGLLQMEQTALDRRGWQTRLDQVEMPIPIGDSGRLCGGDWPNADEVEIVRCLKSTETLT